MFDRDDVLVLARGAGYVLIALLTLFVLAAGAGLAVAVFRWTGGLG